MDDRQVTDSLKKILMAGFGAVSTGVEKSQEVLDKLAEKGESTYQQAVDLGKDAAEKLKKAYEESSIKAFLDREPKQDLLKLAEELPVEDILWLQNELAALAVRKAAEKARTAEADAAAENGADSSEENSSEEDSDEEDSDEEDSSGDDSVG